MHRRRAFIVKCTIVSVAPEASQREMAVCQAVGHEMAVCQAVGREMAVCQAKGRGMTSAAARQVPRHMPLRVRVVVHACVA